MAGRSSAMASKACLHKLGLCSDIVHVCCLAAVPEVITSPAEGTASCLLCHDV